MAGMTGFLSPPSPGEETKAVITGQLQNQETKEVMTFSLEVTPERLERTLQQITMFAGVRGKVVRLVDTSDLSQAVAVAERIVDALEEMLM